MGMSVGSADGEEDHVMSEINTTPLVDIMLVLLTIVLTTSSFIASGKIPVNLPQASSSAQDLDKHKTIEITADGQLYLEGKDCTPDSLRDAIGAFPRETPFVLRADKEVKLQRFIDVADLLKQQGFSRVAVQTTHGSAG